MTTPKLRQIQELRNRTGAELTLIREALHASAGDLDRAEQHIVANRKEARDGGQDAGWIAAYTHQGRIGALVEVRCATDFVARTEEFRQLCQDLVLQVIGGSEESDLETQPWIRDPSRTVASLIDDVARRVGERITVRRHIRWEL